MKAGLTAAIAALSVSLGVSSASAADMAVKAPVYAKAAMAMPYNWSGFYLGANAGVGLGRSRTNVSNPGGTLENETTHLSPFGAIGGGQIGYNWQTSLPLLGPTVFGLEADIQGSGQKTSSCIGSCSLNNNLDVNLSQKLDWFGTVRGRVGLVKGPVLSYLTGGYAYGDVTTSGSLVSGASTIPFATSQTKGGFVLGSGVEAALGGNWTAKLEYLHVDLGKQTTIVSTAGPVAGLFGNPVTVESRVRDNIVRGGINYRFGGNSTYSEPVRNWAGPYVGGNFGSLTARDRSSYSYGSLAFNGNPNNQTVSLVPDGYAGGAQIGYNWQAASWVFGVEADFQGATSKDNKTCISLCRTAAPVVLAMNQKVPYFGTVRGRVGYSVGSTLFYATGGYAYGQVKTDITDFIGGVGTQIVSIRSSKSGYAVGGGIESPLTLFGLFGPAWTIKSEYLYVDLGRTSVSFTNPLLGGGATDTFTTRAQEHIFRTGINYSFNSPVVAKY